MFSFLSPCYRHHLTEVIARSPSLTGYQNEEGMNKKSILGLKINRFLSFARLACWLCLLSSFVSCLRNVFSRKSSIIRTLFHVRECVRNILESSAALMISNLILMTGVGYKDLNLVFMAIRSRFHSQP